MGNRPEHTIMMNEPLLMTLPQVGQALSLSKSTLYRLIARGVLTVSPLTRRNRLVPRSQVLGIVEQAKANVPKTARK